MVIIQINLFGLISYWDHQRQPTLPAIVFIKFFAIVPICALNSSPNIG